MAPPAICNYGPNSPTEMTKVIARRHAGATTRFGAVRLRSLATNLLSQATDGRAERRDVFREGESTFSRRA
jgi:hypothetical protein